jgi:putative hydrolase of the HAD superfamily
MTIRAIIWDLEGVLLHTPDGNVPTSIARRLNVPAEKVYESFNSEFMDRVDIGEFTQDEFWNRMLDVLGLPCEDKRHLLDFINQDFFIDTELVSDILNYHKQYKTALLSNFSNALRPMLNDRWRMDGTFDEIVISSEVHMIKPHPEIYRYTLQKLGCAADETIFIDDRKINIDGAQAIGMHAFQYTNRSDMNRKIQEIVSQG